MTLADTIPRAWWVFRSSPMSRVYVPADTEAEARVKLVANCYVGCPVHTWPCLGSRWCSRERLWA